MMESSSKQIRSAVLLGPVAALLFVVAIAALPTMVPQYDSVRQTVSEIGEVGSPAQRAFTAALLLVATGLFGFAVALRSACRGHGVSGSSACLVACSAISVAGVGWFAFPHPLHNVFGLSELIGYQAPLAFALTGRRAPQWRSMVAFSYVMGVLLWLAILANLVTLDRHGPLWAYERPIYGLVQRALFLTYFVWCAGAGFFLYAGRRLQRPG